MKASEIENWFTHHPPNPQQKRAYELIREKAKELAHCINTLVIMESPDKTAALRKLREAVMTANAAIACYPPPTPRSSDDYEQVTGG